MERTMERGEWYRTRTYRFTGNWFRDWDTKELALAKTQVIGDYFLSGKNEFSQSYVGHGNGCFIMPQDKRAAYREATKQNLEEMLQRGTNIRLDIDIIERLVTFDRTGYGKNITYVTLNCRPIVQDDRWIGKIEVNGNVTSKPDFLGLNHFGWEQVWYFFQDFGELKKALRKELASYIKNFY